MISSLELRVDGCKLYWATFLIVLRIFAKFLQEKEFSGDYLQEKE